MLYLTKYVPTRHSISKQKCLLLQHISLLLELKGDLFGKTGVWREVSTRYGFRKPRPRVFLFQYRRLGSPGRSTMSSMGVDHPYPPSRWFDVREKYLHDRYRSVGRSLREGRKVMNQSSSQHEASSA